MSLGWATSEEAAGCFWRAWTGQFVAIEVEVGCTMASRSTTPQTRHQLTPEPSTAGLAVL